MKKKTLNTYFKLAILVIQMYTETHSTIDLLTLLIFATSLSSLYDVWMQM